jgi:proline iminopeptidase
VTTLGRVSAAEQPSREPLASGRLDVGDGHQIYWRVWGNPQGRPAVVLHGGPGSGCGPHQLDWFDLARYRVVQLDQRNSGRSTPYAGDPVVDLSTNTTPHLVADIERLREHLGIERWLVAGISWGTTLGLAYAEQHPERVSGLVLNSTVLTTHADVEWLTRTMGRVFPEQWERFRDAVPMADRDGDLSAAYARLLRDPDPAVHRPAAQAWCDWEDTHVATYPGHQPHPRYQDPRFRLCFARIVTHYFSHAAFLPDDQLLRDVVRLGGIPGVMIHGVLDISSPADIPWQLSQRWPGSELVLLEAGHGTSRAAMRAVTDRLAED